MMRRRPTAAHERGELNEQSELMRWFLQKLWTTIHATSSSRPLAEPRREVEKVLIMLILLI